MASGTGFVCLFFPGGLLKIVRDLEANTRGSITEGYIERDNRCAGTDGWTDGSKYNPNCDSCLTEV